MTATVRRGLTAAENANRLLRTLMNTHRPECPCHSTSELGPLRRGHDGRLVVGPSRMLPPQQKEYAFEMAASSIRYGQGCTREVGMDMKNLGARKVLVVTDKNVGQLPVLGWVVEALKAEEIELAVYDETMVEPKDSS